MTPEWIKREVENQPLEWISWTEESLVKQKMTQYIALKLEAHEISLLQDALSVVRRPQASHDSLGKKLNLAHRILRGELHGQSTLKALYTIGVMPFQVMENEQT